MNKKSRIVTVVVAAIVVAIIAGGIAFTNSSSRMLKKQLNLGQEYLNDLDYEQAVAAFKNALSIDPDNADAKEGLEKTYIEWINMLYTEGNVDESSRVLNEALDEFQDSEALLQLRESMADHEGEDEQDQNALDQDDLATSEVGLDVNLDVNSYSIIDMPIKSIDYAKMLGSLGGSENPYNPYHCFGSSDEIAIDAISESNEVLHLKQDGLYYNANGDIVEPERKYLTVYDGDGIICQYEYRCSIDRSSFTIDTYHENSASPTEAQKVGEFCVLPFTYGTYEEMNTLFQTDAIMSSGEPEDIGNGYVEYKAATKEGKVIELLYCDVNGSRHYDYTIDGLSISVTFTDGYEYSDQVNYSWKN